MRQPIFITVEQVQWE